jgi:hypothetical protein
MDQYIPTLRSKETGRFYIKLTTSRDTHSEDNQYDRLTSRRYDQHQDNNQSRRSLEVDQSNPKSTRTNSPISYPISHITTNQTQPTNHVFRPQQSREKLPTRLPTRRQPRHGQQQPHGRRQQQQRGRPHVQANGREPCKAPGSAGHHDQQCRWYEPFWGRLDGRKQWYWRRETYNWRRAGRW